MSVSGPRFPLVEITPLLSYDCQSKRLTPRTHLHLLQVQAGFQRESAVPGPPSPPAFGLPARPAMSCPSYSTHGAWSPSLTVPMLAHPPVCHICLCMPKASWGTGLTCLSPRGNKGMQSPSGKLARTKDVPKGETSPVTDPARPREQRTY